MARLTPEAVLRTHQIFPYKDIKLMVERHGFEVREGNGTSHVMVSHPEHTDLHFTLNQTPGRIRDYQHEAAKACIEVIERNAAKEVIVSADDQKTETPFPADMTATTKGDVLIVRHKDYPCIGMSLGFDPEKNGIANIVTRRAPTLREKAAELKDLIKTAQQEYGIEIRTEGKNLVVALPEIVTAEHREAVIAPFNVLTNDDPIETVMEAIEVVSEDMRVTQQFFDNMAGLSIVREFKVDKEAEQPHLRMVISNGLTGHSKTLTSPISAGGVIADSDQVRLLYEMTSHLFEPGTFKALQSQYGIQTTGKSNSTLRLRHPIFDLEERVKNPRPLLESVSRAFKDGVEGENIRQVIDDMSWIQEAADTWNQMNAFADIVLEQLKEIKPQVQELSKVAPQSGVSIDGRAFKKLGEPFTMVFTGGPDNRMRFSSTVSRIQYGKDRCDLFPDGKLDELRTFISDVKAANEQERFAKGGLAVLANPHQPPAEPITGPEALDRFFRFEM